MTRHPLSFGDDDRGQVESFPLWPAALGLAIIVGVQVFEAMQSQLPEPVGETTFCGGGCGVWITEPMLVVAIIASTTIGVALYWTSAPDNTD